MVSSSPHILETRACIAGGGPAGMMLGYLLARAGVDVIVLEKHADFLRDFRGDTVHPSTLEVMHELGFLEEFLALPHQKTARLEGMIGNERIMVADFSHLSTHCKFIALMPQWDFLNFLAEKAKSLPRFRLMMQAEVINLIEEDGCIRGAEVRTPQGMIQVRTPLTIGADGRHSTVRAAAKLPLRDLGAPIDVFWMHLSRKPDDPSQTAGYFLPGKIMVLIDRDSYWQCAFVIPKGDADRVRAEGLDAFRAGIASAVPFLADRINELQGWDDVKLLTVTLDRLMTWYRPGVLCIGDAAHAMSPIGGVGINLAVQDAVAAANILAVPLREGSLNSDHLRAVQQRREWPVKVVQSVQAFLHNRLIRPVIKSSKAFRPPWPLRLIRRFPVLARLPAAFVGIGVRAEHMRSPKA